MSLLVVDIESDGPAPGLYSMVSFGVVKMSKKEGIGETFYGKTRPISEMFLPSALAISNISREVHESYPDPSIEMKRFTDWIKTQTDSRPVFVSDNPAFDWSFMNYYLWKYTGNNPFGHSARRIGDFYAGLKGDFFARQDWRKLRDTKHTHNPVDDAMGNAEALYKLIKTK